MLRQSRSNNQTLNVMNRAGAGNTAMNVFQVQLSPWPRAGKRMKGNYGESERNIPQPGDASYSRFTISSIVYGCRLATGDYISRRRDFNDCAPAVLASLFQEIIRLGDG